VPEFIIFHSDPGPDKDRWITTIGLGSSSYFSLDLNYLEKCWYNFVKFVGTCITLDYSWRYNVHLLAFMTVSNPISDSELPRRIRRFPKETTLLSFRAHVRIRYENVLYCNFKVWVIYRTCKNNLTTGI
jgi:hypothetical protein